MAQQIKKKFLSPEVIEYFDNQIDSVEQSVLSEQSRAEGQEAAIRSEFAAADLLLDGKIEQEILDRQSGDSSTLQSAKDYTDAEVLEEKGLREAADLALDGRITTLEEQVGEDLQAAITALQQADSAEQAAREAADLLLDGRITTLEEQVGEDLQSAITSLQQADAAEAAARIAADNALDARLDVLEAFKYEQVVYVSKNGSDSNSGVQHSPFLTITAALNSISDASPSKRYALKVMPGNYTETLMALKANVFIIGEGQKESIRITGPVSMGSSFTAASSFDHRSGASNVTFLSAANFDWNAVQSAAGKLYFNEVVFASTLSMNGYNNAIAQAQFNASVIFGAFTISGINVGVFTNNVCYGNVTLNQHPNGGMVSTLSATGGYCGGTVRLTSTVNDFNRRCSVFLRGFWSENLISDGPVSYADVDLTSGSKQGAQTLNGGQVIALNPVVSHDLTTQMIVPRNTNSHNMGDWGKQWTWNFGYVHASTGTDLFLISYPSSYAPDSAGKSIGIYTDGAGLQENVNGGEIVLETAATSGTGVRGKIQLNGREIDVTSKQIKNLADGTLATDAVNKGQLDSAKSDVQSQIDAEKARIDAILLASDADKDSFAEIVALINSVDTENDTAFGNYVLSNNTRVDALEAKGFGKGSVVVGSELAYIDLDREYATILSMSVGRLAVHEGEDYTVSVVGGVTRITWIGSLVNPGGVEAIETGDKVFYSGAY